MLTGRICRAKADHARGGAAIVRRVPEQLPIAVLVSGAGTNLQALLDTAKALARAEAAGVPSAVFARAGYADRHERDGALADWLTQRGARLIVLAGYMELLGAEFLERFAGAVINVHPSLLPSFPGLDAIGQALDYGVQVFGVTVHFVDDGIDTGPVILQRAIELPDAREPDQVLSALRPLEHALLPQAVRLIARGALRPDAANARRIRSEG
jgi:phosphoribosylglycinamide formyltransferase-1